MLADQIEAHPTLPGQLESIRKQAAVAMGISDDVGSVPGSIPKIAMVSAPQSYTLPSGKRAEEGFCDLVVRAISVGQPHRAVPITVAMALAVASRTKGSVAEQLTSTTLVDSDGVTLGHNSGRILVGATFDQDGTVKEATVFRTARRIMQGNIYWRKKDVGVS